MGYNDIVILIPTLNPKVKLLSVVSLLIKNGFFNIVVVDDGSDDKFIINKLNGVKVLNHDYNRGKGCALKTGFDYIRGLDVKGVITIDDDLQHDISDIKNICDLFLKNEGIYFGIRLFEDAPFVRKKSNMLTSYIFEKLYSLKICDTQTGLRLFPKKILDDLINVEGNRFEYEMNVLKFCAWKGFNIKQIPIKTIYFKEKKGSHYKVLKDSFLIYRELFRR